MGGNITIYDKYFQYESKHDTQYGIILQGVILKTAIGDYSIGTRIPLVIISFATGQMKFYDLALRHGFDLVFSEKQESMNSVIEDKIKYVRSLDVESDIFLFEVNVLQSFTVLSVGHCCSLMIVSFENSYIETYRELHEFHISLQ